MNTPECTSNHRISDQCPVMRKTLLDGAIGSELQRRGASIDPVLWSATATLSHPEILKAVHCDYIHAGSDIITANTFFCSKNNVLHAGRGGEFVALNACAVRIARQASDESDSRPLVAGSLSTMPPLNRASHVDKGAKTTRYFSEQIQIMEDEGADLLLLEMLLECDSAAGLLEACGKSHLPVWAGLSASVSEDNGALIGFRRPGSYERLNEESFESLCAKVAEYKPAAIGIMHTRPELIDSALKVLRTVNTDSAFVYPNVGFFRKPEWVFPDEKEIGALCEKLVEISEIHNLHTLGGCCGTTPEFIKRLGAAMRQFHGLS